MLDLRQYNSFGAALRAALDRWPNEICLIEADRERENARLTYRQFKEARAAAGSRAGIRGPSEWHARSHHHDQSVEMADFRLRDFLLRRRAGAARLQTHSRGAIEASRAFARRISGNRIPSLARNHAGAGIQESWHARGPGHRSASQRRPRRRKTLGRFSRIGRAGVRPARTQGRGVHRLFIRHRRPPQRLRPDAR